MDEHGGLQRVPLSVAGGSRRKTGQQRDSIASLAGPSAGSDPLLALADDGSRC